MTAINVTRITATELARNLSDILNRARYRREHFEVVRNGEVVAVIEPPAKRFTAADFAELLRRLPPTDDQFADDLEEAHRLMNQPPILPPSWES